MILLLNLENDNAVQSCMFIVVLNIQDENLCSQNSSEPRNQLKCMSVGVWMLVCVCMPPIFSVSN